MANRHKDPDYLKKWRAANQDKIKAYRKKHAAELNKKAAQRVKERNAAIIAAKEFAPEYYEAVKKKRHEINQRHKKKHAEKYRAIKRASYHKHKDAINARRRAKRRAAK